MSETKRIVGAIIWIALLLSAIVWLLRISSAVTFDRPFLGGTSGCEEEALFSVWKAANGYDVYNNPWLPPFSASYFGWLFYEVYGMWAQVGLAICGLDDAWLPTLTRFFTLLGLLACIGIFYRILKSATGHSAGPVLSQLLGIAALVFINPLFHWWAFTTRADVWALGWELAALLAAFHYAQSDRIRSIVLVGLFAFLAWSFRQTNISVLVGFGLWLLFDGKWKALLVMVPVMAVAFGLTMAVLGMNFMYSAFTANALSGDMLLQVAISNAISALTKSPFFALALGVSTFLGFQARHWWKNAVARLAFLAATTSLLLAGALSAKVGASSNYYFPPAALVPIFAAVAWIRGAFSPATGGGLIALGALAVSFASGLVLTGAIGNLRVQGDEHLHDMRALRTTYPQPVFSTDRVANLPWILGNGENSYVLGYAYQRMLAARPENFTDGTIADLLRGGWFSTVVIAEENFSYDPEEDELLRYEPRAGYKGKVLIRR